MFRRNILPASSGSRSEAIKKAEAYSPPLNLVTVSSSDTPANFRQTTRGRIQENITFQSQFTLPNISVTRFEK
jgi:hypothetical protein